MDRILNGTLKPVTEIEILKDTPTTVVMDAHDGMGMVVSENGEAMTNSEEILSAALAGGPFMKALNGLDADGSRTMYHLSYQFPFEK